jgi:hypothetical protein
MSQFFVGVTAGSLPPSVPLQFTASDATIAIPAGNNLNVFGANGATTTASGSTITITTTGIAGNYVDVVGVPLGTTYVVAADDYFISCDSTAGVITIQLPDAPTQYDTFVIKDRTGTAETNNITVTTVGGVVLIDGSTSYIFDEEYESIEVLFNGSSYEIW